MEVVLLVVEVVVVVGVSVMEGSAQIFSTG